MRIDLQAAIETTEELLAGLQRLDETEINETPTRAAKSQRTEINRTLLYLAHLGDRTKVQVMDTYHAFKLRDE